MVYSKTPAGTLNVAIDGKYKGLVLPNEYYFEVHPGQEMKLRVKRVYEDGVIGLTPRKTRLNERDALQEKIVKYMKKNEELIFIWINYFINNTSYIIFTKFCCT